MYRGEIQNDSNGGNYNRSLDYTPSSGGLGYAGRGETRNFAVGAPLRGGGIGRCEEDEYNCCGLYGRGENEEMEDDPCWEGYEMIGTKMKKGREVPNCVPVRGGGDGTKRPRSPSPSPPRAPPPPPEEPAPPPRPLPAGNFVCGECGDNILMGTREWRGRAVLDDGTPLCGYCADNVSASEGDEDGMSAEEDEEEGGGKPFTKKQLTKIILDKNKVIADLEENAYGEGFWEDVRKGLVKYNERKKTTPISEEDWKKQMEDFKAPTEDWGADELGGGAAPKAEPKAPSGVAAAAEALQPVRTAIQNKVGDLIYGKEDDPKKQKKGLLGISEEGKEESQKKVMKNIVVPIVKTAKQLGQNIEDTWNQSFNKDKYDADMKERRIKQIKKEEAEAGIVRDKENPMIIIRKPRGMWKADTTDPTVEAYNRKRVLKWNRGAKTEAEQNKEVYYIRVPNPIFAAKLKPSFKEFSDAGVKLWTGVEQLKKGESEDVDGTLKQLQDDPFIFIPEDRAKEIYGQLRQFVADKQDEGVMEGYEDEGWTKGQMKAFAKIDPRTLKGQELIDWKESKLALDKVTTQNALEKVTKDIAEEEKGKTVIRGERPVRIEPDKARLAKMREAKVRVENRLKELSLRGQQEFKDMMMFQNAEKAKRDAEYYARQKADAAEADADANEEFKALSPAERSIQLDAYRKELQEQGLTDEQIEEQIGAVGGAGSDDEDDVDIIEVVLSKMERYFVDAPQKNEKGELVGLPLGTYKKAISNPVGIGNRRVYDPETEEELGFLKDPIFKKLAMKVLKMEKGWRDENLKKLGFKRDEDSDGDSIASASSRGGGAKPVEMKQGDYYKEHQNIVKLLKDTGKSLLSEAKDQQGEATAMAKKMGAPDPFGDELVGEGAIEFTLARAGKSLFNPTGDMTKAGIQTFTPDYDAYGDTVVEGRKNAFNLSRSMYDQSKAIDVDGFELIEDDISLRFYLKDDEDVILVGIRGTDVKSYTDLYTWAVIGAKQDFRMTTRFQDDLQKLLAFQKSHPMKDYYYIATGSSLAGSIADRFLDMGLIDEAITYNPSIEKKYILDADIHNHRVYLDTDPLFILMGQYAPNTEIRKNASRADFYNPIKEKDYLISSHSIYPVFNPAFEGGGMMGAGKTYTLEEWKAIFDAKLEQKRQQIEAREAKKKQTARAKRARAKARRDEREKPREPEPDPPAPPPAPPAPPAQKRKPRLKIVAPASARVELREELVAEQPREPEGQFAREAEPLQLVVSEVSQAPQRAYMKLMKSPIFTDTERKLLTKIRETKMTPKMRAVLLGRSGLARKVMEMLGINETAFQSQRARARIADTMEKRVRNTKQISAFILPKEAQDYIDTTVAYAIKRIAELRKSNVVVKQMRKGTVTVGVNVGEPESHPDLTKKQLIEYEDGAVRWMGNGRRFGLGAIEVVRNALQEDPFGMWYNGIGIKLKKLLPRERPASHTKSHTLQLVCEMTRKMDEDTIIRAELDGAELVFNTIESKPLVRLTRAMLGALKEDGLLCSQGVNKGIMKKQSTYWTCVMGGTSEVKRWTEAENQRWLMIAKQDILPKLEERISGLRPLFESATENAREKADKALRPTELKMLVELRAERKKEADAEARKNSKLLQDADARLKRYKENYWMTGNYKMKGDPFQQQSGKLEHYFIDELGNKVVLGLEWGKDFSLNIHKLNQLWRDFYRMDEATDTTIENTDYKQKQAAKDIMEINPEDNKVRLVSIEVQRADGSVFIPASYIHDWVYNDVSIARRNKVDTPGYSLYATDYKKPTNAEEDGFYGAMVQTVRRNMRDATFRSYGLAIYILPQMVARFSDWTQSKAKRGKWEEEWDANPEEFMKEAFGKAFDLN